MLNGSLGPPVGTPARANSSARMTCSVALSPAPPYSWGQPGSQIVGLVERLAPLGHELDDVVTLERPQAGPVRRKLLGEECLHLLAVRLGLWGVGGIHGVRGYSSALDRGHWSRPATLHLPAAARTPTARPPARPARCGRRSRAAISRRMVSSIASPKVSTTTPDSTNVDTSNAAADDAIARPTMIPVRSTIDGVARRSGAVHLGFEGRRRGEGGKAPGGTAHAQAGPPGSTVTCAIDPALPWAPAEADPVE